MLDITLKHPEFILEPVSMEALDDFHEYSIKSDLHLFLEFEPFKTLEDTRAYLEKLMARSDSESAQYWFIRLLTENKVIGSIGLHNLDPARKTVEIGYGISPDYWGQGIFTKAGLILIDHIFNSLRLHRIVARTASENIASIRGLEKLGFKVEGTMRDYYCFTDKSWHNATLMSLLSTD